MVCHRRIEAEIDASHFGKNEGAASVIEAASFWEGRVSTRPHYALSTAHSLRSRGRGDNGESRAENRAFRVSHADLKAVGKIGGSVGRRMPRSGLEWTERAAEIVELKPVAGAERIYCATLMRRGFSGVPSEIVGARIQQSSD